MPTFITRRTAQHSVNVYESHSPIYFKSLFFFRKYTFV